MVVRHERLLQRVRTREVDLLVLPSMPGGDPPAVPVPTTAPAAAGAA